MIDFFETNRCMVYGLRSIMHGEYQLAQTYVWWSYVVLPHRRKGWLR
jgi:hypothetical protein